MFLVYTSGYPRGTAFWDQEELPGAGNFFLDENDIWVLQPQTQAIPAPPLVAVTDDEILPSARNYFRDENDIPWAPQYASQYGVRFAYSDDEILPNAVNVFNDEADIFWVAQTQTWWPGGYLVAPDLEDTLGFVVFPGDDEYFLDFPSRRWVTRAYTRPVDEVWVPNIFGDEDYQLDLLWRRWLTRSEIVSDDEAIGFVVAALPRDEDYKLDLFWQRWVARTDVVSDDEALGFVAAFDEDYWLSWPTTTWPAGVVVTDDEILANAKNFGLEDGIPRFPSRQRWPLNQAVPVVDEDWVQFVAPPVAPRVVVQRLSIS